MSFLIRFLKLASVSMSVIMLSATLVHADPNRVSVGQKAPDFDLAVSGSDANLRLSSVLRDGPAVVVVLRGYPGYQCGLCRRQVAQMIAKHNDFLAKNTQVILVYPGEPNLLETHASEFVPASSLPEPFTLVRDPGFKMVNAYGLRWDAPNETAYPSTFVVDQAGVITWAKISNGHAGRSNVSDVLAAL
ncbi:MAG: peroxiredoxin family protein [Planctomycetota bacterium]